MHVILRELVLSDFILQRWRRSLLGLVLNLQRPEAGIDEDEFSVDYGPKKADESGRADRTEERRIGSVIERAGEKARIAFIRHRDDERQGILAANLAANHRLLGAHPDDEQSRLVGRDPYPIIQFNGAALGTKPSARKY